MCRSGTPVGGPGAFGSALPALAESSCGAGPARTAVLRAPGAAPVDGPRVWGGTGCVSPSLRLWGCRWRGEAALVRRPAGSAPAAESGAVLPPDGESLNYTASSIPCPVPPGCWSPGAVAGRPAGEARTRQSVPSQQGAGTLAGPLRRCRPGKPMTWRQRLAWGHGPPRERRAAGAVLGQAAAAGGPCGPCRHRGHIPPGARP